MNRSYFDDASSDKQLATPSQSSSRSPRVLLVTRRFWPHSAGRHEPAAAAVELATRWSDAGMHVEVVTPRYGTHWPVEFTFGQIDVHRIAAAPRGDWSTQRYVRTLGNWLAQQAARFDSIVCDELRDDSRAVATAVNQVAQSNSQSRQRPTVGIAICNGWGGDADEVWIRQHRSGTRVLRAAPSLDAVVTRGPAADRSMVSQGISRDQVHRLPLGFPRPPEIKLERKLAARKSLATANSDLKTLPNSTVLLWCGSMQGKPNVHSSVGLLAQSARIMCQRFFDLRIWMLGDGELHDWLHTELKAEGVRSVVSVPGSFSDMTDVFHAVDGVLQTDESHLRYIVPKSLSAGLPLLLSDQSSTRQWFADKLAPEVVDSLAWYDRSRPATFRKAFRTVWDDLPLAREHARAIGDELNRLHPLTTEMNQWRSLFTHHQPTRADQ